MKKRLLVIVCMLVLLVCISSAATIPAAAAEGTYQVGYAQVDINPYVTDGDPNSGIMALPLRGYGDVWNRPSLHLIDDNGDDTVTTADGLSATCIAVTDSHDQTVLFITLDLIGGALVSDIRNEICARLPDQISANQIMVAGTHTHGAPDTTVLNSSSRPTGVNAETGIDYDKMNEDLGIWIDRTIEDIGDAAVAAMADRTAATMLKGELSASESTAAAGRVMNAVRHYLQTDSKGVEYAAGDNFNSRGSDPTQVSEVNDVMYLLQFSFAEDSEKEDIVLANWRGHPSLNSGNDRNALTSDYVNAFRYQLEQAGYRAAFFQGEGGNVNPRGYELDENGKKAYAWIDAFNKKTGDVERGNGYGGVLGKMALECLTQHMNSVTVGTIRTTQTTMIADRPNSYSDLAYDAAAAAKAYYASGKSGKYIYTDSVTGEKYVIASKFHANAVLSRWNREESRPIVLKPTEIELNAIVLGKDVAFVTIPGEPFDRYSSEATLETANLYNDWDKLLGEALGADHGTPFVLGYCNGAIGYIPNALAYTYNTSADCYGKYAIGSYESHTTRLAPGTGEAMICVLQEMLDHVNDDILYRTAWCEHCEKTVQWSPMSNMINNVANSTGHYYLAEDTECPQKFVYDNQSLCLDLNGHTLTGAATRAFHLSGGTLNIMDTSPEGTGVVRGRGGSGESFWGASIYVYSKSAVFNLYGGTIERHQVEGYSVTYGGVIYVRGTFNMYGGTITGGTAKISGGNLYIGSTGQFFMQGGRITAGEAPEGPSVTVVGSVTLAEDASVNHLWFPDIEAEHLTIQGTYTGIARLGFATEVTEGQDIGTSIDANLLGASVKVEGSKLVPMVAGSDLILCQDTSICERIYPALDIQPKTVSQAHYAGSRAELTFQYLPAYEAEIVYAHVYDAFGAQVADSSTEYRNTENTLTQEHTLSWLTEDCTPGLYTVIVSTEYYAYKDWQKTPFTHTFHIYLNDPDSQPADTWFDTDNGRMYLQQTGAWATGMTQIDGARYYFDEHGILQTGWTCIGDSWYYLDESGIMRISGWVQRDTGWCYVGADGKMQTSTWILDGTDWYYVDPEGFRMTNCWQLDSIGWCYLDEDGKMVTNKWVRDSVGWCYLGADGYCLTSCWQRDSIGWCYLDGNGRMVTNQWIRDSVGWCYLGADGYCLTSCWQRDSIGWCYLDGNGRMVTNKWVRDSVGWCYIGADGYAVTNCWQRDSIGWCYLNSEGSMTKNAWIEDGGKTYYLDSNGYMVTGTVFIGGRVYHFTTTGIFIG